MDINSTYKFKENIIERDVGKTMHCCNEKLWTRKEETMAVL